MGNQFLITPSKLPDPPKEKTIVFKNLAGGLNLLELDYRMDANESPEMKNLWWRDGVLGCRDGQAFLSEQELGIGVCACQRLFWGYAVLHIGDGLYAGIPSPDMTLQKLCGGLPEVRGTFLWYQDALLYKTRGVFKQITWSGGEWKAEDVKPYVPVTVINCGPDGSGDLYQPENRLSPQKIVWYNVARETHGVTFTGNGTAVEFVYTTEGDEPVETVEQVLVGTTLLAAEQYTLSEDKLTVTLTQAPADGETVSVVYTVGVRVYHLPVTAVDSIDKVLLDGEEVSGWTADPAAGTVIFDTAPPVQTPMVNNTLQITYTKENADARKSILDCRFGCSYGGTGDGVLVLAGSEAQPNACFWNGGHTAMDPGYFPVSYYNLVGDNLDAVTGFGQQAGFLMVFKERGVGRCQLGTETIGDRAYLTLNYTPVNSVLGCDLPWTIQTVENNLVWCSTYAGVCRLEDTTAALENQVRCISRKINGCQGRDGLLALVRKASAVCSLNDGERYWVAADGQVFLWDFSISSASNPSWFYFTDIPAVDFFRGDSLDPGMEDGLPYSGARRVFHLDSRGRVTRFIRSFRDYDAPIEKVYRFSTQVFDYYERLKHVTRLRIATRSDTDTEIQIQYLTDHGERWDQTPIVSRSWRLSPRDLTFRFLGVRRFAHVALRKPNCRHIHHFALRLENKVAGCDMSIVSAEITARLVGRMR